VWEPTEKEKGRRKGGKVDDLWWWMGVLILKREAICNRGLEQDGKIVLESIVFDDCQSFCRIPSMCLTQSSKKKKEVLKINSTRLCRKNSAQWKLNPSEHTDE
jgi:hypothetical protein